MSENTAVATRDNDRQVSQIFDTSESKTFCTMTPNTPKEKAMLFAAMTKPTATIKSMINKEIVVQHIFARKVMFAAEIDEKTGEIVKPEEEGIRVALISPDGKSYVASAKGIQSAVTNLLSLYAEEDFPVTIVPCEVPSKRGNVLTFDIKA